MGSCNSYCCQKEHEDKNIHIADLQRQLDEMRARVGQLQEELLAEVSDNACLIGQRGKAEAERDSLAAAAVAMLEAIDSELDTDERSAAFLGRVSRLRAALDTAKGAEK